MFDNFRRFGRDMFGYFRRFGSVWFGYRFYTQPKLVNEKELFKKEEITMAASMIFPLVEEMLDPVSRDSSQDSIIVLVASVLSEYETYLFSFKNGTSRQRSGKGAIRKSFPLQKPRWEKTK